jgi:ribosome assembly protein YihI (activator of Der GTPase)
MSEDWKQAVSARLDQQIAQGEVSMSPAPALNALIAALHANGTLSTTDRDFVLAHWDRAEAAWQARSPDHAPLNMPGISSSTDPLKPG